MGLVTIPYSKRMLIERVQRHVNNDFPGENFSTSVNEIMLYIDEGVSAAIPLLAYKAAAIDEVFHSLEVPEAFIVRFLLTAVEQDTPSGNYFCTLPQPPISLPLGYSINRAYAIIPGSGETVSFFPIKAKRVSYRKYMPMPDGVRYWITNNTMWMAASNGLTLLNYSIYVEMPTGRTSDLDAPLNMPDDIIEEIIKNTVQKVSQRAMQIRDNIKDNEPAGNSKVKAGN